MGLRSDGTRRWRCSIAANQTKRYPGEKPHLTFRKDVCERCGFSPEHICQLDVHHLDHDHENNDPANLQTLCANCHRLIHFAKKPPPKRGLPAN